ncbi:AAA family ATPase [Chitinophaga vietnamensis]|uniref:AAA family ATPase n=1 Tax=Chitinophaga vietnamensis TaxID=2593957 RepID=UPI0011781ADD|nr:AAA family ATPase [Chitinophaga vietnamensis]
MPFIRSFSVNTHLRHPFPYNVPAVRNAQNIKLDNKVTIFTGDNGTGKSTLLESIALKLNLPLIAGNISNGQDFLAARQLQPFLQLQQVRKQLHGFFFRAEDFSAYIHQLRQKQRGDNAFLTDIMKDEVADSVIKEIEENMNSVLKDMRRNYGENLLAFSHGEGYLKIIQTKVGDNGIFLLDEPEAALSPLKQLSLILLIREATKSNNSQFIIATHSPIIMGMPEALIYEITEDEIRQTAFEATEHYRITYSFLSNPELYLRHF